MRGEMPLWMLLSLSILTMSAATFPPTAGLAELACSGHKLLRDPRPESSCSNVKPAIYASPDGTLRALMFPVDVSLYATPDMESRIVIRTAKGDTLTSKDYSPRAAPTGIMSSMQSGRRIRNSSSTAWRHRAVTRPGRFP